MTIGKDNQAILAKTQNKSLKTIFEIFLETRNALEVSFTKLSMVDISSLMEFVVANNITTLNLISNNIEANEASVLAEALAKNTNITTLNLHSNNIGGEGTKILADALERNKTITTLYLSWSNIGNEGAKYMADRLGKDTIITTLGLPSNDIGDEGATVLAEALGRNTTITTLDLSWNDIGDEGAQVLAEALEKNITITTLNLGNNPIENYETESGERIKKLLERNKLNAGIETFIQSLLQKEDLTKSKGEFINRLIVKDKDKLTEIREEFSEVLRETLKNKADEDKNFRDKLIGFADLTEAEQNQIASKIIQWFSKINIKTKGAGFTNNSGYKKDFIQNIVDFFVSAFYSIITFDSTQFDYWSIKNSQMIVTNPQEFKIFLEDTVKEDEVNKGKTKFSKMLEEILSTEVTKSPAK